MKGIRFWISRVLLLVSLGCFFPDTFLAQPTPIGGVVNTYIEVKAVDTLSNRLILANDADSALIGLNDLVMIYQTQGAAIQSGASNAAFGSITNLQGAGSFELGRVCSIGGGDVAIENKLLQTYYDTTVSDASIQVIIVPEYHDAIVNGSLSAQAWDGSTGGVLAISVLDSLYVNGSIDVSEQGFRGGVKLIDTVNCTFLSSSPAYAYPSAYGGTGVGAKKGEGIAVFIPGQEFGRGPQANGGGGGNGHNTGGAGGGNGAVGGNGGERVPSGFFSCTGINPGISGVSLAAFGYSAGQQRAFLGGGGGAGEKNNNTLDCENGGNGGGLVLIIANVITGNGAILSDGGSVGAPCSDGNGGGGAGGSILLNANIIDGAGLTISASGGDGGDTKINCEGPGGGGSGGVIWSSVPPGGAATDVAGGASGIATDPGCSNSPQGATPGSAGAVVTAGLAPPLGIDPFPCVLQTAFDPNQNQALPESLTARSFAVRLLQNPAPSPTLLLQGLTPDRAVRYQLMDLMGTSILRDSVMPDGSDITIEFSKASIPAGTYLIRIFHNGQASTLRFLLLR